MKVMLNEAVSKVFEYITDTINSAGRILRTKFGGTSSELPPMTPEEITLLRLKFAIREDIAEVRQLLADNPGIAPKFDQPKGEIYTSLILLAAGATKDNMELVDLLLEHGANIDATDEYQRTGLYWAVYEGKIELVEHLLRNGANPSIHNPLRACGSKYATDPIRMAKLLVEHGAELNHVETLADGSKVTALDWYQNTKPELCAYLVSQGAKSADEVLGVANAPAMPIDALESLIVGHFEKKYGKVTRGSIGQIVSESAECVVRWIEPQGSNKSLVLFTVGMSRFPQKVPFGESEYRFAEMFLELPETWPTPDRAIERLETAWPIQWLQQFAAYPSAHGTWLGGPVSIIANGTPPTPLGPGCPFTAWMLGCNTDEKYSIPYEDGKRIVLNRCYPLHSDEYAYERKRGTNALMSLFLKRGLSDVIDVNRPSVVRGKI